MTDGNHSHLWSQSILDPTRQIIDAHHHIFDRPGRRYLSDSYGADVTAGHDIIGSVYMEAGAFPRPEGPDYLRPIGEVEFANGVAAMAAAGHFGGARLCAGIVGHVDMRLGDSVALFLDRALATAPERFRGIRQLAIDHPSPAAMAVVVSPPPKGLLSSNAFRDGFWHLAARSLSFDVAVFHVQFAQVADLADAYPDTQLILNHMGMVFGRGMDAQARAALRKDWAAGLRELARRPNIACKLGGLGMPVWGFGFEERSIKPDVVEVADAWGPYIQTAIEAFGANRCMMESNFPIDSVSCDYVTLWNAMKRITSGYSEQEKDMLFAGTAARIYKISGPDNKKETIS